MTPDFKAFKKADFHVHTTFSDGKESPEAMCEAALAMGLSAIGFSDHAPMPFYTDWCMKKEDEILYIREINRLKEKYEGRLFVFLGLEADLYSEFDREQYDYIIGSVHFLKIDGEYYNIDNSKEDFLEICRDHFAGNFIEMAKFYFEETEKLVPMKPDIVGHFDYMKLYNKNNELFSTNNPKYTEAWQKAAKKLVQTSKFFEINTGGISRGYTKDAYPSLEIAEFLHYNKSKFILSGDAHQSNALCGSFREMGELYEKYL